MVFTTALLALNTVALPVDTGTWSPTSSVAGWLSTTTSDGLERIFTSVYWLKALRIICGLAPTFPAIKLKPGRLGVIIGIVVPVVLLTEPWLLLVRKNCT